MQGNPKIIAELNKLLKNELTAINQYFLHARMMKHWGFERLGKKVYEESIGGGFRYGSASAYAIVVVIFSIIIATFALRVLSGLLKDEERA